MLLLSVWELGSGLTLFAKISLLSCLSAQAGELASLAKMTTTARLDVS